jgi:hypothetical protein
MNRRPAFSTILKTDWASFLSFLAPVVFIGLYIALIVFGKIPDVRALKRAGQIRWIGADEAHFFLYGAILLAFVGVIVFWRRYTSIDRAFTRGTERPGVVVFVRQFKDRGRVEYEYEVEGQKYRAGNAIHLTKAARQLKEGDSVSVFVDPRKPARGFIRELYIPDHRA